MRYLVKASVSINIEISCEPEMRRLMADAELATKFSNYTLQSITPIGPATGDPNVETWVAPEVGVKQ